jgi:histidyl-tRNA synthetase
MSSPLQTLKGFRDFLPQEKRERDFVIARLKTIFARFGFEPLETPTLEYASVLLGKYGQEADKLVYTFTDRGERQIGLRYDQTVPTARVLAQYQHQLPGHFRRYQIQNVFRADKPQKGRWREFTQCDIDIFGSTSPVADAEVLSCVYQAYSGLGLTDLRLEINHRATLIETLSPFATEAVNVMSLIQSVDKLDKLTETQVVEELVAKGLEAAPARSALAAIQAAPLSSALAEIFSHAISLGVPESALVYSPTIARGLDYYTGMIFEIKTPTYPAGSLGAGGRYDNLIQDLGGPSIPAVGMAFGFDRTVEALRELGLLPATQAAAQVLVTYFDDTTLRTSLEATQALRAAGITVTVYPQADKLPKQLKYAEASHIPWVVMIGSDEQAAGKIMLKNLATRSQESLPLAEAITRVSAGN